MAVSDLKVKSFDPVENAQPPRRMTEGAVGFDFYAEEIVKETPRSIWYRTGFGVNIPNGCFGDLRARSSVSETGLILANGAGVVDPDYQGEVQFRFYKSDIDDLVRTDQDADRQKGALRFNRNVDVYQPGDRLGQLIVVPTETGTFSGVEVVEDFTETTERGEGGFGSTGK